MRSLLVLPLLLALASCGTGRGVSVAKTATAPAPSVILAMPLSVAPNVITAPVPEGAVLVWYADPRCQPQIAAISLPPLALRDCLVREARLAALRIALRDKVRLGPLSPCYPFVGVERTNCLDVAARRSPGVSYGLSPRWTVGLLEGQPYEGCAAGISGDPIFVSMADRTRVNGLHCWEGSNEWLWKTLDRPDLTDGAIVGESTTAALAACGV